MNIALVSGFKLCAALTHSISCNSDNSVQKDIFAGNMYFILENHVLNLFLLRILYYKYCLVMKALSVHHLSVCAHLLVLSSLQATIMYRRVLGEKME